MASTVITIEPSVVQKKIRVAAYCRVSSSSDDQLHSFAAQVQYYTKFIRSNDQMELVDIYADEGLTGTKTAKRDEFNRMVADCNKGKIDRVLTKSLSRFARNTADALMYARILRENGVSILFEKENIDTASGNPTAHTLHQGSIERKASDILQGRHDHRRRHIKQNGKAQSYKKP